MLSVVDAARAAAVAKVVVVLPATVLYGHPSARSLPAKEGEIVPRGVRGVVAKAIVDLLTVYREQHDIEFTALAATTVYGPRQQPRRGVVATLLDAAVNGEPARLTGDGRQSRDFVHVDDVVDALVLTRRRGTGLVVNVGTGVQTSLRDLAAMIGGVQQPSFVAERADELMRFYVSPVRARIHLGWAPRTSLSDGIAGLREGIAASPDVAVAVRRRRPTSPQPSARRRSGVDITEGTSTGRMPDGRHGTGESGVDRIDHERRRRSARTAGRRPRRKARARARAGAGRRGP